MLAWDNLEGKTIKNRYEVQKTIGTGGGGKVYLAKDLVDNKFVAIKTSNPKQTMSNYQIRFKKEANILRKLNNDYVIAFYDYFTEGGIEMIVMEYVEGISLEDKLKKEKRLSQEETLKYIKQLLSALTEVHSHHVYHRDIKTDNIHITLEGNIKLLDFGIIQETVDQDLTRQGSVIGTVSYLAPEIIRNPNIKANERTDLYSVGIMMYQLLLGFKPFTVDESIPFERKNNVLAKNILEKNPISPHESDSLISKELSYFVMKLIERNPVDRYQNTKTAISDLEKIINHDTDDIKNLQSYYKQEEEDSGSKKMIVILSSIIGVVLIIIIVLIIAMLIT